jgi:hypothetical protein
MEERPLRVRRDLVLQPVERDVEPVVDDVPAAELDLAQLGMVELVPVDVRVRVVLLRPLDQLEVVFDRVLSDPVGEVVVGQPRLALRAPELGRP